VRDVVFEMAKANAQKIALIVVVAGMLNFGVFLVGTSVVGGDAVHGDCRNTQGRYYLWDKTRSPSCHEVTRGVYVYSKIHSWSIFLSWPFVMGGALYYAYAKAARRADAAARNPT
jgi:hypothetical protein